MIEQSTIDKKGLENKPPVEGSLKEKVIGNMSPAEGLATNIPKEDIAENLKTQRSLKDRIMKFFESKTVSEMNDPAEIQNMFKKDKESILGSGGETSGGGAEFGKGKSSVLFFYKKYGLGENGKARAEELYAINTELTRISEKLLYLGAIKEPIPEDLRAKGTKLYNDLKEKNRQFFSLMKDAVEKRIAQLQ